MNPHDEPPEEPQEDPQAEWKRIKELFAEAIELPEDKQRSYLESQCPGEPDLVNSVLQLLHEDRVASPELIGPLFDPVSDLSGHLLGRFFLVQRIAEGGMGIVYLARDEDTGKRAAVKVLHEIHKDNPDKQKLFMREARLLQELDHPNVVRILGHGEDSSCYYVAMDFVEGFNLHEYMSSQVEAPAIDIHEPKVLATMIEKLSDALDHCHARGILHRDIKPHNIMITPEGEPILVDFGLAKEFDKTTLSLTVGFAGSLEYMSPEQALFHIHKIDHRTDIFSLGVVFYELLARHHPYRKDATDTHDEVLRRIASKPPLPLPSNNKDIPTDLGRIAMKALRQDREERFQTAGEMAYCLSQYRAGRRVQIPQRPLPYRMLGLVKNHTVSATVLVMLPFLIFFGIAALAQPFMQARVLFQVLNHDEVGEAEVLYQELETYPNTYASEWQALGSTSGGSVSVTMEPGFYRFVISSGPDHYITTQRLLSPGAQAEVVVRLLDLATVTEGMIETQERSILQGFPVYKDNSPEKPLSLTLQVPSFYIDTRPVTVGEWLRFLEARHPDRLETWPAAQVRHFERPPRPDFFDLPATKMSWAEAREYAQWVGKRLPESWEWSSAAMGDDPTWWKKVNRSLINNNLKQVMKDLPKEYQEKYPKGHKNEGLEIWDRFEISWFAQGRPCEDPKKMICSPSGLYQAIGNINEWTMTPRAILVQDIEAIQCDPIYAYLKCYSFFRSNKVVYEWPELAKNGRFLDPLYVSLATGKGNREIHLGFRCAKTKTPSLHQR